MADRLPRRSSCSGSSARHLGPTSTSRAPRSAHRRPTSTRAGAQAGACACSTVWWRTTTNADARRGDAMTEMLFYHLQQQTLEAVLPTLLEKSIERGWRVIVQASSQDRVEALDNFLWTFREDSFLPHGTDREGNAAVQPVLLTADDRNPNAAT